jgi:hypothetical protein
MLLQDTFEKKFSRFFTDYTKQTAFAGHMFNISVNLFSIVFENSTTSLIRIAAA